MTSVLVAEGLRSRGVTTTVPEEPRDRFCDRMTLPITREERTTLKAWAKAEHRSNRAFAHILIAEGLQRRGIAPAVADSVTDDAA